jgi:hypothetical protein
MDSRIESRQSMMEEMLAGDGEVPTFEMAAELERMKARVDGISGMMQLGIAHFSMMHGKMMGEE